MSTDYEDVTAPAGEYISWEHVGEVVEGVILAFGLTMGTTFDGDPCPMVAVRTDNGAVVNVTASQANLMRTFQVAAGRMKPGHRIRIEYAGNYKTDKGSQGKEFNVGVSKAPALDDVTSYTADEEPF